MKKVFQGILIFAGILLVSAVLAPLLFKVLPFKFERIFNRLVMVFSLIAIVAWVRIRRETFIHFGLMWQRASKAWFFRGFLAGVFVLGLLTVLRMASGFVRFSWPDRALMDLLMLPFGALGAGLLIGLIEEFFFRGVVQKTLRENARLPWFLTIALTNLFYSALHFVHGKKPFIGPDPTVGDSFRLMTAPFLSLADWPAIGPAFLGLFLFGCVLSDLAIRTKSLYASIGLHAGCVFFLKIDGAFISVVGTPNLWMGTKVFYDGAVGWIVLILLGAVLRRVIRPATVLDPAVSS